MRTKGEKVGKGIFDKARIEFSCPDCDFQMAKEVGWLNSHSHIVCEGCGTSIRLETKSLKSGIASAENAIDDFSKRIDKLNQRN